MCEQEDQADGTLTKLAVTDSIAEPSDAISLSDSDSEDCASPLDAEVKDLSSGEDSSEKDIPEEHMGSSTQEPLFQLKGGSIGFSARSHSIFDCLESAAKRATPGLGEDNIIDGPFVRPVLPPPKKVGEKRCLSSSKPAQGHSLSSRGVPDYVAHPERWTKYSLEDVLETSNSRNSQVAQEYIQGLQKQRDEKSGSDVQKPFTVAFNQDHSSSSEGKIVFSRPGQTSDAQLGRKCGETKKAVGLYHLEDLGTEEECAHPGTGEETRKRKWVSEKGDSDHEQQQPLGGFNSGQRVNRKNFRRMSEKDDD